MGICVFGWAEDKKPALRYSEDLRQQAEKGDDDAQFQLGDCYFFGLGIPKDQVEGELVPQGGPSGSDESPVQSGWMLA